MRSDHGHSQVSMLPGLCLGAAGGSFLAAAAIAVFWLAAGVEQSDNVASGGLVVLVGLVALGLASCVLMVFLVLSEPVAVPVPVPAVQQPVAPQRAESPAWVVPEPLWRRLEPLPDDGSPLPAQVARRLGEAIDAGRFTAGAALPPDQQIARLLNVSAGTVRRAKTLAITWGYLQRAYDGGFTVAARSRPTAGA